MHPRLSLALAACAATALTGCSALRIDRPIRVASGMASQLVCSGTFVSGLDPQRVFAETVQALPRIGLVDWAMHQQIDAGRRQVTTTVAGAFETRAVYRDGHGCLLLQDDAAVDFEPDAGAVAPLPALLPEIAPAQVVEAADARLRDALARAFAEPEQPPYRNMRAVVVVQHGKVVAERYAAGIGIRTPLLSFSVSKSITHALVGVLVRQGKLSPDAPAPLPAWSDPADPRRAVTLDTLLRQTSGLALTQTSSGFDPSTRLKYLERDGAGFAQQAALEVEPGRRWDYTDGNYALLSRIVRDSVGGHAAGVRRFAEHELFGPLGMRDVTIEFDATGTPQGAHSIYASARDLARLGLLYLNDGVAGGRRILPEGWVRHAASPTLDTGYGAGFFTNHVAGKVPQWDVPWGMPHVPRDAFFARGFLGQYIVVVPSRDLVVVRMASAHALRFSGDDIKGMDRLMADVLAALE